MKIKYFISIGTLCLLLCGQIVFAQELGYVPKGKKNIRREVRGGGMGYFSIGLGIPQSNRLEAVIQQSVGKAYAQENFALSLGGRGFGCMGKNVFLGGGGYAIVNGSQTLENAQVNTSVGAGFFNIGYAILADENMLLLPFIGFGGGGTNVEIKNLSDKPIVFDRTAFESIPAGRKRNYSAGNFMFEVGLTAQLYVVGGFAVGLEAGGYFMPNASWLDANQNDVRGVESVNARGGYLRLTVGGGGFVRKSRG